MEFDERRTKVCFAGTSIGDSMYNSDIVDNNFVKSRKILGILFIAVLMLALTTYGAIAAHTNYILDNNTTELVADIYIGNNVTDYTAIALKFNITSLPLSTEEVGVAKLCMFIIATNDTLTNNVSACQVLSLRFSEETGTTGNILCSEYNNIKNVTMTSTTNSTWSCMDVTHILNGWTSEDSFAGTQFAGIRIESVDFYPNEQEDNDQYTDDGILPIGWVGHKYIYFEDREGTSGTNKTPYLNITMNVAPIAICQISPGSPLSTSDLSCDVVATDADGDSLTTSYYWYRNDVLTSLNTSTIGSGNTTLAENWKCEAVVYDGYTNATAVSQTVTITSAGGGGGGGGGGGTLEVIIPENGTFTTIPRDIADVLVGPGDNTTFNIDVISTSSTGTSIKLKVTDNCGIYSSYNSSIKSLNEYVSISGYEQLRYTLYLSIPEEYKTESCSIYATITSKDGTTAVLQLRVWNTFWTRLLKGTLRVISYPIVFEKDRTSIDFMTKTAFIAFPSAIDFKLPFFGLAVLIFSFIMIRYLLYRIFEELRSKNSRPFLFLICFSITAVIGLLMGMPLGIAIPATSIIYSIVFVAIIIGLSITAFRLPRPR